MFFCHDFCEILFGCLSLSLSSLTYLSLSFKKHPFVLRIYGHLRPCNLIGNKSKSNWWKQNIYKSSLISKTIKQFSYISFPINPYYRKPLDYSYRPTVRCLHSTLICMIRRTPPLVPLKIFTSIKIDIFELSNQRVHSVQTE